MWNMVFANKTCNEFNRFKEHRDFLEKLSQTRHAIDTSAPIKPKFFANGAKKKVMKRETEREIDYQNRILYYSNINIEKINGLKDSKFALNFTMPKFFTNNLVMLNIFICVLCS